MQPRVNSGFTQDHVHPPAPGHLMTFDWLPGTYQVVDYTVSEGVIALTFTPADQVAQEYWRTEEGA